MGLDFIGDAAFGVFGGGGLPSMNTNSSAYGQQGDSGGLTVGDFNLGSNNMPVYVIAGVVGLIGLALVLEK